MATPVEVIGIATGVFVPTVTIAVTVVMAKLAARDKKIEILEAKVDLKDEQLIELKIQNSALTVTGVAVNRVLSQLPQASELRREIET